MMMSPIAQSSENASYNDDEDEATNVESSPPPPARTHSILERRRSSSEKIYFIQLRYFDDEIHQQCVMNSSPS